MSDRSFVDSSNEIYSETTTTNPNPNLQKKIKTPSTIEQSNVNISSTNSHQRSSAISTEDTSTTTTAAAGSEISSSSSTSMSTGFENFQNSPTIGAMENFPITPPIRSPIEQDRTDSSTTPDLDETIAYGIPDGSISTDSDRSVPIDRSISSSANNDEEDGGRRKFHLRRPLRPRSINTDRFWGSIVDFQSSEQSTTSSSAISLSPAISTTSSKRPFTSDVRPQESSTSISVNQRIRRKIESNHYYRPSSAANERFDIRKPALIESYLNFEEKASDHDDQSIDQKEDGQESIDQEDDDQSIACGSSSTGDDGNSECLGSIQDCSCIDLPEAISRCLECYEQHDLDNGTSYCRFRDFRKLLITSTNDDPEDISTTIQTSGFLCVKHDLDYCTRTEASNFREWLPPTRTDGDDSTADQNRVDTDGQSIDDQDRQVSSHKSPTEIDRQTAGFILPHIQDYYRQLLNKERILLKSEFLTDKTSDCLPWKDTAGIRELCDVCSTTLYNLHVLCARCGLSVCADCYADRLDQVERDSTSKSTHDKFGWHYCTRRNEDGKKIAHQPVDMTLAHIIPDCDKEVLSTLDRLEKDLKNCVSSSNLTINDTLLIPTTDQIDDGTIKDSSNHWRMFDGQILVLKEVGSSENLRLFQEHWKSSNPLIVENIDGCLSQTLWRPNVFAELCRSHGECMDCIVDCRTGKSKKSKQEGITIDIFWQGFVDCAKRKRDSKDNRKMCLKLKDWPPGEKFGDVLREQYEDFCKALPIPEYTHPEFGRFNLATKLPAFALAPDLGPKMYTAYDMIFEPEKGTTNLHLDVSDAVNTLVNVTTPIGISQEYLYREIIDYLEQQNLDPKDLARAKANPSKIGALWTIFKPHDNSVIRKFLMKLADEKLDDDTDDPIHDQKMYLHRSLRERLRKETGVVGFTFVQMLGDAVFIPAGAAHQVQNLLCCIKVAEDFVSPEGVQRCAVIADEFRSLTKDHTNHEDKLQLPNIVTHSIREAITALMQ